MNTTSLYHHDTSGLFSDPLHGHSFVLMNLHSLSSLDSSFLSFRSCLLCHDHLVSVLNTKFIISKRRRRKLKNTTLNGPKVLTDDRVSQCINCSTFIHRDCISFLHYHRNCRHHESLVPVCGQAPLLFPDTIYLPLIDHVQHKTRHKNETQMRLWRLETFTLATLIEELDSSNSNNSTISSSSSRSNTTVGPSAIPLITGRSTSKQLLTASKVAKKWAPLLAAGGVMGALAMGPAAGVIAGINMLVASVGAETVMAGIGLTASAAAALL
ncbi:unnamed protein product [Peronospora belbahrii]|uniref:Phorbol-ester/DAG-type domain-containing protein n=1 Tax=Peronospora belbahrii TaxID=622444 RepID=A0ABN8D7F6_9STRA|nr:unnamed protein product [Peronospora belbahrii]